LRESGEKISFHRFLIGSKMAKTKPKETSEKKQVNVCWITGNFHQRQAIVKKLKSHMASQGEYELSIYDDNVTMEYAQSQVAERSCFDEIRKLIIFTDWPSFKTTKPTMYNHFLKMCQEAGPNVVIVCNDLKTESASFLKGMNEIAKIYEYPSEVKPWEAARWIVGEMARREKEISETDAEIISQAVGPKEGGFAFDIDRLHIACTRICDYIGKKTKIEREDILAVFTDNANFIVWNMYSYLDRKDFPGVMALMSHGYRTAKDIKQFIEQTLYSMIWRYRMLLFAKEGASQGWNVDRISGEILKLHKLKRSGTGWSTRYSADVNEKDNAPKSIYTQKQVEKAFDSNRGKPPIFCYDRKEMFVLTEAITHTMHCIREGTSDNESIALMDGLFMTICGVGDPEQLRALREVDYARYS
jgi:hypothetical protein